MLHAVSCAVVHIVALFALAQITHASAGTDTVVHILLQVRLPTDRETGELKGIAFVEFGSSEAKVCFFTVLLLRTV